MKRREFITLLGSAAAAWPVAARGQQAPVPVIGLLSSIAANGASFLLEPYRRGLKDTGFVEGQNVKVEYRWADGHYDRLPALASELISMRVSVITTMGDAAYAAKAAQSGRNNDVVIPIVFALGDDPVATGLVSSLNRPGAQITGATSFGHALGSKKFELLHQLVPSATTNVMTKLGSRPRARGLARRDVHHFDHSSMSQTASLATRSAGCLARCVAGACFGTEGDRKRTGGHGQGCCTSR